MNPSIDPDDEADLHFPASHGTGKQRIGRGQGFRGLDTLTAVAGADMPDVGNFEGSDYTAPELAFAQLDRGGLRVPCRVVYPKRNSGNEEKQHRRPGAIHCTLPLPRESLLRSRQPQVLYHLVRKDWTYSEAFARSEGRAAVKAIAQSGDGWPKDCHANILPPERLDHGAKGKAQRL